MKNKFFYLLKFHIEEKFKDLFLDYIESNSFYVSIDYSLSKSFKNFWFCNLITNSNLKINYIINNINSFRINLKLEEFKIQKNNFLSVKYISYTKLFDKNWLNKNKQTFKPIKISRFIIYDKDLYKFNNSTKICLKINATSAFGTGYHETTRLCLKKIDLLAKKKKYVRFLDYGSGTGIIGIAAKKLVPFSKISFVDVDINAIKANKLNLFLNNLSMFDKVFNGRNVHKKFKKKNYYDVICANIFLTELKKLVKNFCFLVKNNGYLIISGILKSQRSNLLSSYRKFSLYPIKISEENSWLTIIFKKMK